MVLALLHRNSGRGGFYFIHLQTERTGKLVVLLIGNKQAQMVNIFTKNFELAVVRKDAVNKQRKLQHYSEKQ